MGSSERESFASTTDKDCARARIRQLNDRLRTTLCGGRIMITEGVEQLGPQALADILYRVRTFHAFGSESDPYGEHDFGSIRHAGYTVFWKIDYYAPDLTSGSVDPSDPSITARVLTIMLAADY
jgi:hypothetical protein